MFEGIGPPGVRDFFDGIFAAFPDLALEVLDLVADGNGRVAVRWRSDATFAGPGSFQGYAPNGARITLEGLDLLRVEDGLIVRNDAYSERRRPRPPARPAAARGLGRRPRHDGRDERADGPRPAAGGRGRAGADRRRRLARARRAAAHDERLPDRARRQGRPCSTAGEKRMAAAIAAAAARLGGIDRVVLGHGRHRSPRRGAGASKVPGVLPRARGRGRRGRGGFRDYWRIAEAAARRAGCCTASAPRFVWEGGPVAIAGTVAEGDEVAGFRVIELPGTRPGRSGCGAKQTASRSSATPST